MGGSFCAKQDTIDAESHPSRGKHTTIIYRAPEYQFSQKIIRVIRKNKPHLSIRNWVCLITFAVKPYRVSLFPDASSVKRPPITFHQSTSIKFLKVIISHSRTTQIRPFEIVKKRTRKKAHAPFTQNVNLPPTHGNRRPKRWSGEMVFSVHNKLSTHLGKRARRR